MEALWREVVDKIKIKSNLCGGWCSNMTSGPYGASL
jgi:hypothetical protein